MLFRQNNARAVFRRHAVFIAILCAALLIRFYHISSEMIFIGDQGRDFLSAREVLVHHTIPLLGIPSSVPRFRQGPLFIWATALTLALGNGNPAAVGFLAAFTGTIAIIALYLFGLQSLERKTALFAVLFLTISPMAILHSRMPFVITPIPLVVVLYLWQLVRLQEKKPLAWVGAGLAFGLLFECELATFPLILLIPLAIYLQAGGRVASLKKHVFPLIAGVLVGLLPMVLYDLTHGFRQLVLFLVWTIYRLAVGIISPLHHRGTPQFLAHLPDTFSFFMHIFTESSLTAEKVVWTVLVILAVGTGLYSWKQLSATVKLSLSAVCIMLLSFVLHGAPSEAYFPVLIVFLGITLGWLFTRQSVLLRAIFLLFILGSVVMTWTTLLNQHFFLELPEDPPTSTARFGPSLLLQETVIRTLLVQDQNHCLTLQSQEREQTFPTLIDNFVFITLWLGQRSQTLKPCVSYSIDRTGYLPSIPPNSVNFGSIVATEEKP
jgi:4-amino-4-deoxy-L-arabinose transferase-like glycosyltransferase